MAYNGSPSYRMPKMPGVTVAAVTIIWISTGLGAIFLCMGLSLIGGSPAALGSVGTFLMALLVGAIILNVVLALAIQKRQNWARITAIVFCAIGIGAGLINLFSGEVSAIVSIGINIALIVLLANEASKEWCS
jgi:hypothetical protein